jgi:hypothetical protein
MHTVSDWLALHDLTAPDVLGLLDAGLHDDGIRGFGEDGCGLSTAQPARLPELDACLAGLVVPALAAGFHDGAAVAEIVRRTEIVDASAGDAGPHTCVSAPCAPTPRRKRRIGFYTAATDADSR